MAKHDAKGHIVQGGEQCACGCGSRYSAYYRDGKVYAGLSHYKKVRDAVREKARVAAEEKTAPGNFPL